VLRLLGLAPEHHANSDLDALIEFAEPVSVDVVQVHEITDIVKP